MALYTMLIPGKLAVIPSNISYDKNRDLNYESIIGLQCYETTDCKYFTWISEKYSGPHKSAIKKCFMKNSIPNGITDLDGAISGDKNCGKQGM